MGLKKYSRALALVISCSCLSGTVRTVCKDGLHEFFIGLKHGVCPHCGTEHIKTKLHDAYWTDMKCSNCMTSLQIHIKDETQDTE